QYAARLGGGVVELAALADADRTGADDQDGAKIRAPRHASATWSKNGSPSSGPGAASGWNWTVAKSSPARPSQVPSFSETWLTYSSASTAKPWFCTVTSTRPLRVSRTGWFAPRWPKGSLNVSNPSASPSSWW